VKILTVDDHALVREGLRHVLKGLDAEVQVLDAASGAQALAMADVHFDIDLVLLDYQLPDMDGIRVLSQLGNSHPELPVLIISGVADLNVMREVMARGAAGFITKSGLSDELLEATQSVLAGDRYIPPELRGRSGELTRLSVQTELAPNLTPKQRDVLRRLMEGDTNKDISRRLEMSEETVKNHVSALLRAFGSQSRTQVVMTAIRLGYRSKTQD